MLVQPTSNIPDAKPGQFFLNTTGEVFDHVEAVFLKVTKGRVYFPKDQEERKAICGSADRVRPSPRFEQPVTPLCSDCPYAKWTNKEDGKGQDPPLCSETYNLLGVIQQTGVPFWWAVKSTGMKSTKRLLSGVALFRGKNLFDARITMSSLQATSPNRKYFIPLYAFNWFEGESPFRGAFDLYRKETPESTFEAEDVLTS